MNTRCDCPMCKFNFAAEVKSGLLHCPMCKFTFEAPKEYLEFDHIDLDEHIWRRDFGIKVLDTSLDRVIYGDIDPYSDEGVALFKRFCREKGVTFYCAERQNFFWSAAFARAEREGNRYLIVEDLS